MEEQRHGNDSVQKEKVPEKDELAEEVEAPLGIPHNARIIRLEAEICDDAGFCFILRAKDGEISQKKKG